MRRLLSTAVLAVSLALVVTGCTEGAPKGGTNGADKGGSVKSEGGTLAQVKKRDKLICGINETIPGMGSINADGEHEGFDIDFCKAVAASILDDPSKVEYKPLTTDNRFTALKSREIDVLIRNTTWTASRDGSEGATFLHRTYYDGGGMMVRAGSKYKKLADMNNVVVCILSGTTNEQNLSNAFKERGIKYTPLSFDDNEPLQQAFQKKRCDGWFSDRSQLAAIRSAWPERHGGPEALRILTETYSKEPLGPVVRDGDSQWAQVVNWSILAPIQAEEFGITQANVDEMRRTSDDPDIQRFLGKAVEGKPFDPGLGLDPDFAYRVIKAVGNYGEMFDRHLGPDTPRGLERGVNALWTDGGLQYAPPYR